jgi:putative ABC transport system permease protein
VRFLTEFGAQPDGGIIGLLLGWAISLSVAHRRQRRPISPAIGLDTICWRHCSPTAVGLFFGLYPANQAASLERSGPSI